MKNYIPGTLNCHVTTDGEVTNRYGKILASYIASGYEQIKLSRNDGTRITKGVHRAVWEAHNGPIPKGMWINHKDGNKLNNQLSNLEVTTPSENHIHARDVLKRKYARGTDTGMSKLSIEGIEAVRMLLSKGWSQHKISKAFGVSQPCISYIARGKRWAHTTVTS